MAYTKASFPNFVEEDDDDDDEDADVSYRPEPSRTFGIHSESIRLNALLASTPPPITGGTSTSSQSRIKRQDQRVRMTTAADAVDDTAAAADGAGERDPHLAVLSMHVSYQF